jgi:hypothetical protein
MRFMVDSVGVTSLGVHHVHGNKWKRFTGINAKSADFGAFAFDFNQSLALAVAFVVVHQRLPAE